MKKTIALVLSVILLVTFCTTAFAASFYDFTDTHWAASYVNKLVSEGTINGFEDGTFRPAGTVTRAEFVKMIGKGPDYRSSDFADVSSDHWAYDYIMASGLDAAHDNMFMPSQPITRGEVVDLLWKRALEPQGCTTPPVISSQGKNPDAVSWAYTNSIMTGDNNIDLRLADTLTRAEAAALIVRSREVNETTKKTFFHESADPKVLEVAYNAFGFVDKEYSENATLTNGELAMAAARLLSGLDTPDYPGVSATKSFDHKYAQPLNMLCRSYLGEDKDNIEYIEKEATVKDAIMALAFATLRTMHTTSKYDANGPLYPNVTAYGETSEKLLKFAYQNGIALASDMSSVADKSITLKEFASLLLQFDGFSGFHSIRPVATSKFPKDYKINTNLDTYPSNSEDYRIILASIPQKVYETPFVDAVNTPAQTYKTTSTFEGIFTLMFEKLFNKASSLGTELSIVSTPVLSVQTQNGYTFRVKLAVVKKGEASVLSDIINCSNDTIGSKILSDGEAFWLDINTGRPINTLDIPLEDIYVNQLI